MAKSYKSALPTWTTYTPYVSPLSTQQAVNAVPLWRNLAHGYQPTSTHGIYQRIAMDTQSMVKGTGTQHAVGNILAHRPVSQKLNERGGNIGDLWRQRMQESVQGNPDAPRTAPATVNPTDQQTQQNARAGVDVLAASAAASSTVGDTAMGPRRYQTIFNRVRNLRSQ